jgi:hypothetical protein
MGGKGGRGLGRSFKNMGPPISGIIKYLYNDPFMGWRDGFFFFYISQAETGEIKVGTHSLRQGYWPRLIIYIKKGSMGLDLEFYK